MTLAIVQVPTTEAIRPYCGAKPTSTLDVHSTRLGDGMVHGAPRPAWADVGLASHMRSAVVPAPVEEAEETMQPFFQAKSCVFRFAAAIVAVIEAVASYLAYVETRDPGDLLYNKFEAYALLMPGLEYSLLVVSILNTGYIVGFGLLICVSQMDLFLTFAKFRLVLSGACGIISVMLAVIAESTKVFPSLCIFIVLVNSQTWVLHNLFTQTKELRVQRRRLLAGLAVLIAALAIAWCLMFLLGGIAFLQTDACPATRNKAMPVSIQGVNEVQCAKWGTTHQIRRVPVQGERVYQGFCTTSYEVFDQNGTASYTAHDVRCPPSCQTLGLGTSVIGCSVYDGRSSICAAAVQMGVLPVDQAGIVRVVGRPPPTTWDGARCIANGVQTIVPGSAADTKSRTGAPVAFYFQGTQGTLSFDTLTLHSWSKNGVLKTREPWKSFDVDVSWSVGGSVPQRSKVPLGPQSGTGNGIQVNFCSPPDKKKTQCP